MIETNGKLGICDGKPASRMYQRLYVPAMFGMDIMIGNPKAAAHVAVDLHNKA